jgi:hypothetical protein
MAFFRSGECYLAYIIVDRSFQHPWRIGSQYFPRIETCKGSKYHIRINPPPSKSNRTQKRSQRNNNRQNSSQFFQRGQTVLPQEIMIPRALGFAAPRYRCWLRYSTLTQMNNAGFTTTNLRFNPTYAYDINPTIGSTAAPGFNELAGMYRYYRVRASRIKVNFANNEAFNGLVAVLPVNFDPTQNHSVAITTSYLSQPVCRTKPVGPLTGQSRATITHEASTSQFGGAADYDIADDYSASTTGTAPINSWFWDVIFTPGTSTLVSGIFVHVNIDIDIEFFEIGAPAA